MLKIEWNTTMQSNNVMFFASFHGMKAHGFIEHLDAIIDHLLHLNVDVHSQNASKPIRWIS